MYVHRGWHGPCAAHIRALSVNIVAHPTLGPVALASIGCRPAALNWALCVLRSRNVTFTLKPIHNKSDDSRCTAAILRQPLAVRVLLLLAGVTMQPTAEAGYISALTRWAAYWCPRETLFDCAWAGLTICNPPYKI